MPAHSSNAALRTFLCLPEAVDTAGRLGLLRGVDGRLQKVDARGGGESEADRCSPKCGGEDSAASIRRGATRLELAKRGVSLARVRLP